MKKLITLSLTVVLTVSCSAQWGKRIKGNGNTVTIERSTGDYDAIALAGWFDIELVDGKEGELTLKGEENLLEYIVTEVKNGKLIVKVEKGINLKPSSWKGGMLITIPVESINSVSVSGSGNIVGKKRIKTSDFETSISGSGDVELGIEANSIAASMSGSGNLELNGKTSSFEVSVSGSGDIEAFELDADEVDASVSGSANIKVTANEMLRARVSGSGDIDYRGNPDKVDTKTSGSGSISKG